MTASPGKRDVQRNTAYFLGAAGALPQARFA